MKASEVSFTRLYTTGETEQPVLSRNPIHPSSETRSRSKSSVPGGGKVRVNVFRQVDVFFFSMFKGGDHSTFTRHRRDSAIPNAAINYQGLKRDREETRCHS